MYDSVILQYLTIRFKTHQNALKRYHASYNGKKLEIPGFHGILTLADKSAKESWRHYKKETGA